LAQPNRGDARLFAVRNRQDDRNIRHVWIQMLARWNMEIVAYGKPGNIPAADRVMQCSPDDLARARGVFRALLADYRGLRKGWRDRRRQRSRGGYAATFSRPEDARDILVRPRRAQHVIEAKARRRTATAEGRTKAANRPRASRWSRWPAGGDFEAVFEGRRILRHQ
jgi:hypothetical protein